MNARDGETGSHLADELLALRTRIFADGADVNSIKALAAIPLITGFTTNPTLMRKAGVSDYESFALEVLRLVAPRPISFEVFADRFDEMERQARRMARWGENVVVKIPVTDTAGNSSSEVIRHLSAEAIPLNVTAVMTRDQVREATAALSGGAPSFVSVFAGRIADTGRDPLPLMSDAVQIVRTASNVSLIWASPRELLNIFQADSIGCDVITVTSDVLAKLPLVGKDLSAYSLETVRMFFEDGERAGYKLDGSAQSS